MCTAAQQSPQLGSSVPDVPQVALARLDPSAESLDGARTTDVRVTSSSIFWGDLVEQQDLPAPSVSIPIRKCRYGAPGRGAPISQMGPDAPLGGRNTTKIHAIELTH